MTLSIRTKLFLVLLLVSALSVLAVQASMYWSFRAGFRDMIEQRLRTRIDDIGVRLIAQYREDGGWSRIAHDRRLWIALVDTHRPARQTPLPARRQRPPPLSRRLMLFDADGTPIYGRAKLLEGALRLPLMVDGTLLGELALLPGPPLHEAAELRFRQRQTAVLPLIALGALGLSVLLAWWLSRWLSRPVLRFRAVARRLAGGEFEARVRVSGRDELAGLGQDLNTLAATLAHNEQARRHWMADISHELRTPVSLMRAELEALQDGVRALDAAALANLHGDVMRLSHLIEDLYELSLSELGALRYRWCEMDLAEVVEAEISAFGARVAAAGLTVRLEHDPETPHLIRGDASRLAQLLGIVLRNSVQYTDHGGAVLVRLSADGECWALDVQDTPPGVPDTERARLFERLYRVEPSRNRQAGGAGLGLAIAKNIAEAHQGSIEALSAPQGGLWIHIRLPRLPG